MFAEPQCNRAAQRETKQVMKGVHARCEAEQPGTNFRGSQLQMCNACGNVQPNGVLKACMRCRIKYYCGKECQRRDWKAGHKHVCVPAA